MGHTLNYCGTVSFTQKNDMLTIITKVTKKYVLSPGSHGFHIHEKGDLRQGCTSLGSHLNPTNKNHGDLKDGHMGDLGNIVAKSDGTVSSRLITKKLKLTGKHSILGRSIVIHSDPDDLGKGNNDESLLTGNSGERVLCGIIALS